MPPETHRISKPDGKPGIGDSGGEMTNKTTKLPVIPTGTAEALKRLHGFQSIFKTTGKIRNLVDIIPRVEELATSDPFGPARAMFLDLLETRYRNTGRLGDLEKIIKWGEKVVVAIPPNHAGQRALLTGLGIVHLWRNERLGAVEDLQQVIRYTEQAVSVVPKGGPNRAQLFTNMGVILATRYERSGAIEDLDRAIAGGSQATRELLSDNPGRARVLGALCTSLVLRYDQFGALKDQPEAIKLADEAVDAAPVGHPD